MLRHVTRQPRDATSVPVWFPAAGVELAAAAAAAAADGSAAVAALMTDSCLWLHPLPTARHIYTHRRHVM